LGLSLGAPTCAAAAVALAIVAARNRRIVPSVVKGISWSVLPLVAGLFVLVEAMEGAGLLRVGMAGLDALQHRPAWLARAAAAWIVALASNGMNNLPIGLMSGAAIRHSQAGGDVVNAILIGVDLGPNLSVTGSLATILWLIALRREGVQVSAWEFLKIGIVAMPLALMASLLLLRG
jgi:arsenical pump membrane protein